MKIAVPENQYLPAKYTMDYLRTLGTVVLDETYNEQDFVKACIGADIVVLNTGIVDKLFFEKCPTVKFIIKWGVGVDTINLDLASEKGVVVCHCPHYGSLEVAEWSFMMTLNYMRKFVPISNAMTDNGWAVTREVDYGKSLRGLTIGVIGLGRVGKAYGRMVAPFGAKLVAYSQSSTLDSDMLGYSTQLSSIEEVLKVSDIVSLNMKLTSGTAHIINSKMLSHMKKDAVIVNVSRGALVDEDAIFMALENNTLGGYVSDVFETEPLPQDSPLQKHPKTLLTPHMAYLSIQAHTRLDVELVRGIENFTKNKKLVSMINTEALKQYGYEFDTYEYGELPYSLDSI